MFLINVDELRRQKDSFNSEFERRMAEFEGGVGKKPRRTKHPQQQYACSCTTMRTFRGDILSSTCKDCIVNGVAIPLVCRYLFIFNSIELVFSYRTTYNIQITFVLLFYYLIPDISAMNKGLINVVYVVLNYIFNDSSHQLQVTCLRPMLIQLYTYLICCILDRTVLRPVAGRYGRRDHQGRAPRR